MPRRGPPTHPYPVGTSAELGTLDRRQIATLVGLAPFNRESGTRRGNCIVWGGRARVRATLYMGTLVASRCSPVIKVCTGLAPMSLRRCMVPVCRATVSAVVIRKVCMVRVMCGLAVVEESPRYGVIVHCPHRAMKALFLALCLGIIGPGHE